MLAGVLRARTTGRGCDCDVSLFEVALAQLNYIATWTLSRGFTPQRQHGSAHPSITPFQTYPTADGWIVIAAPKQSLWEAMARALELPQLLDDARFTGFAERLEHRPELTAAIEARLQTATTGVWVDRLTSAGVPCSSINSVADAFDDPQARARAVVQNVPHPDLGDVGHVVSALRLSGDHDEEIAPAPRLGEHTNEVLKELCGYDDQMIDELRSAGVFGGHV
jgi:crotonobetainyl-CoA:carnitine CoA-transferase CaiB-like acyl-CoA transferase